MRTSITELKGNVLQQRRDLDRLRLASQKAQTDRAALDPKKLSPDFITQRQLEISREFQETAIPLLTAMRGRQKLAEDARAWWSPGMRRLQATLEAPERAAALAARVARVGEKQLRLLAESAKQQGDWLLADAILTAHGGDEALAGVLETMTDGDVDAVGEAASEIHQGYGDAVLLVNSGTGEQPSGRDMIEHAFAYGRTTEPATV
jgi:hypothetical protein